MKKLKNIFHLHTKQTLRGKDESSINGKYLFCKKEAEDSWLIIIS